jgi:hypothetical protein
LQYPQKIIYFSNLFYVGIVTHPEIELHDDVVATEVGHQLEVAERDEIDHPPRVA